MHGNGMNECNTAGCAESGGSAKCNKAGQGGAGASAHKRGGEGRREPQGGLRRTSQLSMDTQYDRVDGTTHIA